MAGDWPRDLAEAFLENVPTTLLHLSLDGVIQYINPEAERILGSEARAGMDLSALVDEPDRDRFSAFLQRCASDTSGASAFLPNIAVRCGDLTRRMDAACRAHPAIRGMRGLALVLVDITQHERELADLSRRATQDALTRLGNAAS